MSRFIWECPNCKAEATHDDYFTCPYDKHGGCDWKRKVIDSASALCKEEPQEERMNKNQIEIIIRGPMTSGKSTIAHYLQTVLSRIWKIEVKVEDPDFQVHENFTPAQRRACLQAVREKTAVRIVTQQTALRAGDVIEFKAGETKTVTLPQQRLVPTTAEIRADMDKMREATERFNELANTDPPIAKDSRDAKFKWWCPNCGAKATHPDPFSCANPKYKYCDWARRFMTNPASEIFDSKVTHRWTTPVVPPQMTSEEKLKSWPQNGATVKVCDCGAAKCKTTHADWCSTRS